MGMIPTHDPRVRIFLALHLVDVHPGFWRERHLRAFILVMLGDNGSRNLEVGSVLVLINIANQHSANLDNLSFLFPAHVYRSAGMLPDRFMRAAADQNPEAGCCWKFLFEKTIYIYLADI